MLAEGWKKIPALGWGDGLALGCMSYMLNDLSSMPRSPAPHAPLQALLGLSVELGPVT